MITIRPGSTTVDAGTATWASTLAIATAVPGSQAGPARGLGGQPAGLRAQLADLARKLVIDQMFQPGSERLEEVVRREAVVLRPDALVAGGGEVARLAAGELPDDPVRRLDQPVGRGVNLRILVQDLPRLGHKPLGADLAAVAVQERVPALAGDLVELVGLGLGGVMLPQLHPGVRPVAVLGQEAERRAVRFGRQHRAGGEVDAQADHVGGADAAGLKDCRDRLLEDLDVVVRILQRPIRFQPHAAGIGRQALVDHAVGVGVDIRGDFVAVGDIDEQRPARLGAEIDPDCVFWHGFLQNDCGCARSQRDGGNGGERLFLGPSRRQATRRSLTQSCERGNKTRAIGQGDCI